MRGMDYQRALPYRYWPAIRYSYWVKQRIGIYSGTFDPIHIGHISFAKEALRRARLDRVIFMPEPHPRGKDMATDIRHRLTLVTAAIADTKEFSLLEPIAERFNIADTLPLLHRMFQDAELTLLLGSDVVRTFSDRWPGLDVLLGDVALVIGMRTHDTFDEIIAILTKLERKYKLKINYLLVEASDAHAASSTIRAAISDAVDLHPDVSHYINGHNLYSKD
jgi:nicotinate-nucleotide adenylyltransferase